LLLSLLGLLAVVLVLPVSETTRGQLLSLIGIVLSAAIALSSTTFVGNAMAGFMLRAVRAFKPGDFVRIGDYFGRVSEQGLFHVEIQTEDRDLATLPNLYLVTHPYKVVRASGTLISAEVSLAYEVASGRIKECLLSAAETAGLTDPFVHIMSLGDFAVTFRVAGLLTEVKQVLSSRSRLHEEMLKSLHSAGIEIVSPTIMTTRALSTEHLMVPPSGSELSTSDSGASAQAEDVVFDKAQEAETREELRSRLGILAERIKTQRELKKSTTGSQKATLEQEIQLLERQKDQLQAEIANREADVDGS